MSLDCGRLIIEQYFRDLPPVAISLLTVFPKLFRPVSAVVSLPGGLWSKVLVFSGTEVSCAEHHSQCRVASGRLLG